MNSKIFECLSQNFGTEIAESSMRWAEHPKHHILTITDKNYPKLLCQIHKPPPILFVEGNIDILNECQIAMVGCRRMSHYGRDIAYKFAQNLAEIGIVITSGLALGIDTASHQGALHSGQTIAILGSGLKQIYPSSNRKLAEKIAENGALVSEFPLDMPANKLTFPQRNRLISGMSIATIVIEAAVKSGSLITAKFALEQNKEVFAVPGSIHSPQSKGCHQLIRQGATLVESIEDILFELKPKLRHEIKVAVKDLQSPKEHDNNKKASGDYSTILQHLGSDSLSVDQLVEQTGLTIEQLSSMLLVMELEGFLTQVPGGYIRKK
ncbi:MAG: Rossmann fold nucleotide-binding protein Smf involved in uptake [Gammaproteobacteria bacterium]|jgi:DNA processing protein|nr:Rossmann fold nucleotide-binding protein Smf involved in uptake [Gammaproteobacteria bacterium]